VNGIGSEFGGSESVGVLEGARVDGPSPAKARVVVGIADLAFHQEVLDLLGRDPRIEIVGAVTGPDRFTAQVVDGGADALVMCPEIASRLPSVVAGALPCVFLVAQEMTVPALRLAIDVGAQGAFCWPEERGDLLDVAARARRAERSRQDARGRVVAVLGARGGAGVTFVASHLAAVLASSQRSVVLVDMDPLFSDLTAALGVGEDGPVPSVTDLLPVMGELSPEHITQALYRHAGGFSVLLRRGSASEGADVEGVAQAVPVGLYAASVALLAGDHDVVLMHVGRSSDTFARAAIELADVVLLVTGLDLLSLYGARRLLGSFTLPGDRLRVVANCSRRSDLSVGDAARILGVPISARVGFDPAVGLAQDRARLATRRARRLWKDLRALASATVPVPVHRSDHGSPGAHAVRSVAAAAPGHQDPEAIDAAVPAGHGRREG
jgi:cellulose biosynthesis protein BcsQ